jgi:hypothetical protein
MSDLLIDLSLFLPLEIMLVIEHASGVVYLNQSGGLLCRQSTMEGVLVPLGLSDADAERVMKLPYEPILGITANLADELDGILAVDRSTQHIKVDRSRLHESMEAWVFVRVDTRNLRPDGTPEADYFGLMYGFGAATGVLTWPNSD